MDHFTAAEPPRSDSLPARDAPPAFDRFEILRCARDIGCRGGWTKKLLAHLELLLSCTREDDWGPDRQPAVWLSVRATAEKLGVSPRTVRNHEKALEDMGMLVVRTQGDGRRRGERGEDGRIAWAWGVYLSPARERLPELRAAAAAARRENVDLRTAHAAARDLHGQIRGMLADRGDGGALDELRAELMDMRRRFRRAGAIESVREWISGLQQLLGRLQELLAGIPEAADGESEAAPDPVEAGIPEGGVERNPESLARSFGQAPEPGRVAAREAKPVRGGRLEGGREGDGGMDDIDPAAEAVQLDFLVRETPDCKVSIHRGDCLEVASRLEAESFDLIYIDPPFNTGRRQSRKRLKTVKDPDGDRIGYKGRRYRTTSLGETAFDDSFDDFPGFLEPRLREAYRLLAPNGSLFFHIDYREAHYCKILLDDVFGRASFINEIIWAYDYGARSKKRWSAKHDTIFWYAKNPHAYTYRYDDIDRVPYMAPGLVGPEKVKRGKTPTDVWWQTIVIPNGKERTGYPTQKPIAILDRIVRVHSNPGDRVLDLFAGSGTTGEAAIRNGRNAVLVDESAKAVAVMSERLAFANPVVHEPRG